MALRDQRLNRPRATPELPLPHAGKAGQTDQVADPSAVEVELSGRALDEAVRDEFYRLLNLRSAEGR